MQITIGSDDGIPRPCGYPVPLVGVRILREPEAPLGTTGWPPLAVLSWRCLLVAVPSRGGASPPFRGGAFSWRRLLVAVPSWRRLLVAVPSGGGAFSWRRLVVAVPSRGGAFSRRRLLVAGPSRGSVLLVAVPSRGDAFSWRCLLVARRGGPPRGAGLSWRASWRASHGAPCRAFWRAVSWRAAARLLGRFMAGLCIACRGGPSCGEEPSHSEPCCGGLFCSELWRARPRRADGGAAASRVSWRAPCQQADFSIRELRLERRRGHLRCSESQRRC